MIRPGRGIDNLTGATEKRNAAVHSERPQTPMDVQLIVAVNLMALSALSLLLALLQRRSEMTPFAIVNALVIVAGAAALYWLPQYVGAIVALVFTPFVAAPVALTALQARMTRAGRLEAAARLAALAALFHPTAAMRFTAAFARAAALSDPQEKARALAALAKEAPPAHRSAIEARLLAERGEWERLLALAAADGNERRLAGYRLRALGETGQVEELMRDYERTKDRTPVEQTVFGWLFVLAFGGRPREVERLAAQTLRLDADTVAYWLAVARGQAGEQATARAEFERLAAGPADRPATAAARRQLEKGWTRPAALSPEARKTVEEVAARVETECARHARGWRLPRVTFALVALNALVFVAEIALGGSQNLGTLVALGALWAPLVLQQGEDWRLLTSAFLHFGGMHFALNMLMLALIGRDVEHEIGAIRTLALYLGGALFSSAFVLGLMAFGSVAYGLYVGASGAIFALFGVVGALRVRDWLRHRASLDAFRTAALALAILVQIGADFLLPMSSLAAHLSGFGFGLVAGFFVKPGRGR